MFTFRRKTKTFYFSGKNVAQNISAKEDREI
jgi:hypothetical protein